MTVTISDKHIIIKFTLDEFKNSKVFKVLYAFKNISSVYSSETTTLTIDKNITSMNILNKLQTRKAHKPKKKKKNKPWTAKPSGSNQFHGFMRFEK